MSTPVRFSLLETLVSTRRREPWQAELFIAVTLGTAHLAMAASVPRPVSLALDAAQTETVTYLDIPTPPELESPRAVVKPRPVVVSQAVRIPAVEAEVTRPDQAAGFQELLAPKEIDRLPPAYSGGTAVHERDFSGRGVVGGVAGGKPPMALPPEVAAALAAQGNISDAAVRRAPREVAAVSIDAVQIKPDLINRDEILELLQSLWPPVLRHAGIEGTVIIQFVVDTSGTVRPESARVITSSHELFSQSALQIVRQLRFSPGRMSVAGRLVPVPVHVRAPFKWTQTRE